MYKLKQIINCVIISAVIGTSCITSATNVDPTKPFGQGVLLASDNQATDKLILQSIIHGDGIHTAVINGKVIKHDDYIGQYRLVAINDTSVILRSEDERLKLYVFKASVVK